MAFALTYGGIPFQLDNRRVEEWMHVRLPLEQLTETMQLPAYTGRNLGAAGSMLFPARPPLRIGDFYYPTGASRWSEAHFLATGANAIQMATLSIPSPQTFVMRCDAIGAPLLNDPLPGVSTTMFMLPPRPLAVTGFGNLYLVTLVDDRYYHAQSFTGQLRPDGQMSWATLIQSIANTQGLTISIPAIPAVYGVPSPDSALWANVENAMVLLDICAANVGCVVVRNFDGTYTLQPVSSAFGAQRPLVNIAGGGFSDPVNPNLQFFNLDAVLPSAINVTFPKYLRYYGYIDQSGAATPSRYIPWIRDSYPDVTTKQVLLSSATGTDLNGNAISSYGGTGSSFLHTTSRAYFNFVGDPTPLNDADLTALANQLANDRWNAIANGALDEVYPGIRGWIPEQHHDVIWTYCYRGAWTRVFRKPWNFGLTEFSHQVIPANAVDGPNAGPAIELVRANTSTPNASGQYDAFVERYDGTNFSNGERVWLLSPNGTSLTSGTFYTARLMQRDGSSGRKVYATAGGAGGGGSTGFSGTRTYCGGDGNIHTDTYLNGALQGIA